MVALPAGACSRVDPQARAGRRGYSQNDTVVTAAAARTAEMFAQGMAAGKIALQPVTIVA